MNVDWRILGFYGISILLGLLSGLFGTCFQLAIAWLSSLRLDFADGLLLVFIPEVVSYVIFTCMSAGVAVFLVQTFAPEASGSGVQEIEGALLGHRQVFWRRLLPVKFIAGVLAIGANFVVGREGPTIQMGGNLGEMLGEAFKLTRERRDILIGAGAASGLAAAFNAPLAGIVFILEEMREHFKFSFMSFKSVAIACVTATIVMRAILGQQSAIEMPLYNHPGLSSLVLFFIFGIFVGFAGLLFNIVIVRLLDKVSGFDFKKRLQYALVVAGVVGLFTYYLPGTVGGGYDIIAQALGYKLSTYILLMLFCARFITTVFCYSTGVPGGIFAPMLALGTLLGIAFGQLSLMFFDDAHVYASMFAVAGMGALFSASIRAPVTGIILIVEMTQNYQLILPSMVTCLTATTIVQLANNPPIYAQFLDRALKGQHQLELNTNKS